MASTEEPNQRPRFQGFAGTGVPPRLFFKRVAVVAGVLFVAAAFASGYYTLLYRTAPPPRDPVPIELEEDTAPPSGSQLQFDDDA